MRGRDCNPRRRKTVHLKSIDSKPADGMFFSFGKLLKPNGKTVTAMKHGDDRLTVTHENCRTEQLHRISPGHYLGAGGQHYSKFAPTSTGRLFFPGPSFGGNYSNGFKIPVSASGKRVTGHGGRRNGGGRRR